MTLQEFFDFLSANPIWVLAYFLLVPFAAFITNRLSGARGLQSPWAQTYSVIVFLVAVPGLLAVVLNIYQFLFERQSILLMNLYTQVLPIVSFIATLFIIKRNVHVDQIPGFGKISGLIVMIFGGFAVMWALDRTRIFFVAFRYMPFHYVIGIFVGILIFIRFGWRRLFR